MIVYSISVTVKNTIVREWLDWMQTEHIPEVMKTGYFMNFKLMKEIIPSIDMNETSITINYELKSIDDYYKYAETFAPTLQQKHHEKFSGKFKASRTVFELLNF